MYYYKCAIFIKSLSNYIFMLYFSVISYLIIKYLKNKCHHLEDLLVM